MAAALVPAFAAAFGRPIDRETAELLLALLFIENDHGRAVIEHNWGNISTFVKDGVDYWRPPWFDLDAVNARPDTDPKKARYLALHQQMVDHKAPSAFLAFPDDAHGIMVWLHNVKPSMYDAAKTGDPMAFADAYWASGYCPDDACRDSGPTYRSLQSSIRAAGYFAGLASSGKQSTAAAVVAPSLPSEPPCSSAGSSIEPSGSEVAGADELRGTRAGVVARVLAELELVDSGAFTPSRVNAYWADVLHQAPNLPHPPAWCGALALFCLHGAELGLALRWRFQTVTDKRSGFLYALTRTTEPQPGDVGYQDKPFQHHFLVESVSGEFVSTVEGNQGQPKPIKRGTRSRSSAGVVWFSIRQLLQERV